MKLTCLLSLSDQFRTENGLRKCFNDDYVRMFFNSTKLFLDTQLERDGYVFLKDALKVFGFKIRTVPLSDLCKVWVYKDKRNKVRVRLRKLRIRTGKDQYMTDYAVDFIVPDIRLKNIFRKGKKA